MEKVGMTARYPKTSRFPQRARGQMGVLQCCSFEKFVKLKGSIHGVFNTEFSKLPKGRIKLLSEELRRTEKLLDGVLESGLPGHLPNLNKLRQHVVG